MKRFALIVTIALACPAPTLLAQSRQHQVEPSSKDAPVADIVRSEGAAVAADRLAPRPAGPAGQARMARARRPP